MMVDTTPHVLGTGVTLEGELSVSQFVEMDVNGDVISRGFASNPIQRLHRSCVYLEYAADTT
eukprot:UN11238